MLGATWWFQVPGWRPPLLESTRRLRWSRGRPSLMIHWWTLDIGHYFTKYEVYFIDSSYISHHILQPPVAVIDLDTDQLPSFKLEIKDDLLCPVRIQSVVDCFRPLDYNHIAITFSSKIDAKLWNGGRFCWWTITWAYFNALTSNIDQNQIWTKSFLGTCL